MGQCGGIGSKCLLWLLLSAEHDMCRLWHVLIVIEICSTGLYVISLCRKGRVAEIPKEAVSRDTYKYFLLLIEPTLISDRHKKNILFIRFVEFSRTMLEYFDYYAQFIFYEVENKNLKLLLVNNFFVRYFMNKIM